MNITSREKLLAALSERSEWVDGLLLGEALLSRLRTEHLRKVVRAYIARGGKRLRPAVLMFCCGAVGGDEKSVISAAASLELFHTWTLLHDDIIDHDVLRRGGPSGHVLGSQLGHESYGLPSHMADDYGQTLSILAGDIQHGLCVSLFLTCESSPELLIKLAHMLEHEVVLDLVDGETLDVQLEKRPISNVTLDEVIQMISLKTAVLYEFAGRAGSMLGLQTTDLEHPYVKALASFCYSCGIAFQLQDDILSIVGNESRLGKPVGNDIIAGKRTPLLLAAWEMSSPAQKAILGAALGHPDATSSEIDDAVQVMMATGAVDRVATMAKEHVMTAFESISILPASQYREWLEAWANFMVERDL